MANLSSQFLLPLTGVTTKALRVPAFKETYMKAEGYQCEFGKCLFLQYSNDVASTTSDTLTSLPNYVTTLSNPEKGDLVFVYSVADEDYNKVVKPFVDGEYSAVDRGYVDRYFPRNPASPLWKNRLILDKDPRIVTYWKTRGVEVPEGAEVWDKVKEAKETYTYDKTSIEQAAQPSPESSDSNR